MKEKKDNFVSSFSKLTCALIGLAILAICSLAAGGLLVPLALDGFSYYEGHQAYLQADCATALPKFAKVSSEDRLMDIAQLSTYARQEEAECTLFQAAVEFEEHHDFGMAVAKYMDFISEYADSPLVPAAKQSISALFNEADPSTLANGDTCDRIDPLRDWVIVSQGNEPDIWAPFYWGCAQIHEEANQSQEAFEWYQTLLTQFPNHDLSEKAETALLSNPEVCKQLDQLTSSALADRPDFLPSLISKCSCNDPLGCVVISPNEPVHIAYMLAMSGAVATLGEDSLGGIELAVDDRGGKLLDHDILLTGEDSLCTAEGGQVAATRVAADPTILGVIGTNCSSAATAALPTISSAGLVMLSPSNTGPALTLQGQTWQPGYFRISSTDLLQGKLAAEFAYNELGARTAATIHDNIAYGEQLQQMFADRFQELGGTITYHGNVNAGDTDMRTVLTEVAADSPDVLYFPIFEPEGAYIVAQSSDIEGLEKTTLMSADGLFTISFPENAGPNVVGMYLSGIINLSGTAYDEFLAKWEAKFGSLPPSAFHAFAYDGANILLDAIEKVAIVEGDGTIHVGRQALRDAIKATTNYTGLTGKLDCSDKDFGSFGTSKGDCSTGGAMGIYRITQAELDGNWPPPVVYTP